MLPSFSGSSSEIDDCQVEWIYIDKTEYYRSALEQYQANFVSILFGAHKTQIQLKNFSESRCIIQMDVARHKNCFIHTICVWNIFRYDVRSYLTKKQRWVIRALYYSFLHEVGNITQNREVLSVSQSLCLVSDTTDPITMKFGIALSSKLEFGSCRPNINITLHDTQM
jgi:hypothetical protein